MRTRFARALAALAAVLAFGAANTGTAEAAAPGPCLDAAEWLPRLTAGPSDSYGPSATGYYVTSNRCRDINLNIVSSPDYTDWTALTRVCWVNHGYCNNWRTVPWDGEWHVIATDVLDGTKYRMEFHWPEPMWGSEWSVLYAH